MNPAIRENPEAVCNMFLPLVLQAVRTLCSSFPFHDKEDIAQDVMLKVMEMDVSDIESPQAVAYSLVRNRRTEFLREKDKLSTTSLEHDPIDCYDDEQPGLVLILKSDCLTDAEREVLRLRAQGASYEYLADTLSITSGNARLIASRGISKLREKFEISD